MARLFDAISDTLASPYEATLNISGDLTITLWLMRTALTPLNQSLVSKSNYVGSWDYLLAMYDSRLYLYTTTTNSYANGPYILDTNVWHRLGMRRLGSAVSYVLDGVTSAADAPMTGAFATTTNPFYVGSSDTGTGLKGALAQVRLYNVALTDAEIEAALRGVPVRWANCVRALNCFGVSSPEPDTSIAQQHATVTGAIAAQHPPGISAIWLAPQDQWFHEDVAVAGATLLAQERNIMRRVYGRVFSGVN